jgi:glycosyltransferase involved in cell wall biosynthesis/precorrin-6B methylase 2
MHAVNRTGTILLATLNETETISAVLEEIAEAIHILTPLGWTLSVTIVDDGQGTQLADIAGVCAKRFGIGVEVVAGKKQGLGSAVIQGFEHCLRNPAIEFVVNLDADGQHDGRQIGELLRMISSTDAGITIGSRWTKGGRCSGLSLSRRVLSRCSSIALRMAGVPWHVKDPTTSFRVYDRRTAEVLSRELVGFNGFSFFGAAIATATSYGITVNESPIHFRPRMSGESNLSLKQTFRAIRDLPRISTHAKMVGYREREFNPSTASPKNYSAHRELELLASTPVSTRIIVNTLSPFIGEEVLEVGAGLGLITQMLVDDGKKVTALEPDAGLFSRFSENLKSSGANGYCMTLNEYLGTVAPDASFDTILYVNVLEHIGDDIGELKTALRAMKPDAKVVIFVPAAPRLYGTMDWISGHFRRYRMNELKSVASMAGLKIVECRAFDPIGALPYWLMYRLLKSRTLSNSSVTLYDKIIIPLSAAIPASVIRRTGGKNLILVGQLQSSG